MRGGLFKVLSRWFNGRGVRTRDTPWSAADAVYRRASILPEGGAQRTVAVTRLSSEGARIEFFVREPLPDEVTLVEPIRGVRRRARVLWQEEFVAGLAFIDA